MTALAPTLQAFFTDRLITQRQASRHTIAAYRDTFRLLLGFAADRTGHPPSQLDIADLDAPLIAAFLDHLETSAATASAPATPALPRSTRCSATPRCATPNTPRSIQRVLAIPPKRFDRKLVTYLTEPETDALLAACDRSTWTGRRDHAHVPARRPDRAASLRADRTDLRRHPPRPRSTRPLRRQGPQTTPNTAAARPPSRYCRSGSPNAAATPHDPLFPTSTGAPAEPRRGRTPHRHNHRRPPNMPIDHHQESNRPHTTTHCGYLYWQGACELCEFGGVTRRCRTNIRYFQARPLRLSRELVPR